MASKEAVSRIGESISSILDVPEISQLTSLRSLCLHGNNITRIEAIQHLHGLKDLNLSSNCITSIKGLSAGNICRSLATVNLASNKLADLEGLDCLPNLTYLNLSYNKLTSISSLTAFHSSQDGGGKDQSPEGSLLRTLDLRHNRLETLPLLSVLVGCLELRELSVSGNPMCAAPNYRRVLLGVIPQVVSLDGSSTTIIMQEKVDFDSARVFAAAKLQQATKPTAGPSASGSDQGFREIQSRPSRAPIQTPHVDATLNNFHHRQQIQSMSPPRGTKVSYSQEISPSAPTRSTSLKSATPSQSKSGTLKQAANWPQNQDKRLQQVPEIPPSKPTHDYPHTKVHITDASVQTAESHGQLYVEASNLRGQLARVTDELERKKNVEQQMHKELQVTVQAAQEEAHCRVEEGYREASQAVARALQELESSRAQAIQAQEKAALYQRLLAEEKERTPDLQARLVKFEEELFSERDQSKVEVRRLQSILVEERRLAAEQEHNWQQQLHLAQLQIQAQLSELSTSKSIAATFEQRTAALEASLSQTNQTTLTLTAKIAQVMSDSTGQIEVLREKLASAEHALTDLRRREQESRAEINMLTVSLSSQQHQHQQEMERRTLEAAEEAKKAMDRERGAAEERGKASAWVQSERDKSSLQEQVTYLKMQLQYALKESEKEAAVLQEQVNGSRSEALQLSTSLREVLSKHTEHENLVSDLSHVLQQQKAHIQILQREKESLSAQLKSLAPERLKLEKMAQEILALKRANSELEVLRDQALYHKRSWQDAENRLVELQQSSAHSLDEQQQRTTKLEASLNQAKEEVRASGLVIQKLHGQVAEVEDAVKVKRAMLDSANDTIEQLRGELADLQGELDDARRASEEMESQLGRTHEQDVAEKSNLRSELEAGEVALDRMNTSVADARVKQQEAEHRLKLAQESLSEKESMLNYVNEEVDRVKDLFEKREARLREERDLAQQQAATAMSELDRVLARSSKETHELTQRVESLSQDLEVSRTECQSAYSSAASARKEVDELEARLREVEEEMRQVLMVVERQKQASTAKMRMIATALQEL